MAAQPAYSPRAAEMAQLLESLGAASQTASAVSQRVHRQEARNRELQALEEGHASEAAAQDLPGLLDAIEQGNLAVPDGVDPAAHAAHLADSRSDGMSQAYRDHYRRLLAPRLTSGFYGRQETDRKIAGTNLRSTISTRVANAKDATEIAGLIDSARRISPDITDDQLYSDTVLPAARAAASAGNAERLALFTGVLGDRFPDKQAELAVSLQHSQNRQAEEVNRGFYASVDELYNADTPYDVVREHISLTAPNEAAKRNALDAADRREQAAFGKAFGDMRAEYIRSRQEAVIGDAYAIMDAGADTGGVANIRDVMIPVPGHEPVKFSRDDIIADVRDRKFAAIDAMYDSPDERDRLKMKWLEQNPGVKVPEWQAKMDGIASRISGNDIEKGTVQPAAIEAYRTYKRLGLLNRAVRDTMLSPQSKDVYDSATNFERNLGYDEVSSLVFAARGLHNDTPGATAAAVNPKKAASKVSDIFGTVQNPELGRQVMESIARKYAAETGKSVEDSMDFAAESMKHRWAKVNGWLVRTEGRTVANVNISEVAKYIAASHSNETKYGDTPDDYTLVPDGQDGDWRLWFRNSTPADGGAAWTDSDLVAIQQAINGRDVRAEREQREAARLSRDKQAMATSRANIRGLLTTMSMSKGVSPQMTTYTDLFSKPDLSVGPPVPDVVAEPAHLKAVLDEVYRQRKTEPRAEKSKPGFAKETY